MTEVENKIKLVSNMYRNLKKNNDPANQYKLLNQLEILCKQTSDVLDTVSPTAENTRRMKQIRDIQNKINELKQRNAYKSNITFDDLGDNTLYKQKQQSKQLNRQQISKRITRTIAFEEIKSAQLKVSKEEIEKVAQKMEGNLNLMKEIQCMIVEQGQDVDLIESNILDAYKKINCANKQLDEACELQNQTRLMKIRAGVTGIFATLGWGIMGIPGAFLGLFAGWKATK